MSLIILTQNKSKSNYILTIIFDFNLIFTIFRKKIIQSSMNDGYIAVLDSGIGGLNVLKELVSSLPCERFLYFGDNKNAPYGNKSLYQLERITAKNIDYIKQYNIKALVLGCNTLSVNLMHFIKDYSRLPVFGTYPPVEEYCMKNDKVLLLATEMTARNYSPQKNLHVVGLKKLVKDIENNVFDKSKINIKDNLAYSSGYFVDKKSYYDTVILGCTHYEFLKNEFFNHFCPRKCVSGTNNTVKMICNYFNIQKKSVNHRGKKVLFIGEDAVLNKKVWVYGGQSCIKLVKKIQNNSKKF